MSKQLVFRVILGLALSGLAACGGGGSGSPAPAPPSPPGTLQTLVVIFDENISFDHYFGTYPQAANPPSEPVFIPAADTPPVNNLSQFLLTDNPNLANPFRLDITQNVTCDNINAYSAEQKAYDGGLMDKFVQNTSTMMAGCTPDLAMGYYDGNTVTAMWNYAQHYTMSDNFFETVFGTTVMGHLNLIAGQTHGATPSSVAGKIINGTVIANVEAGFDDCATGTLTQMSGQNIGNLLSAKGITWGWFYGDFARTDVNSDGTAQCSANYNSHYDPFMYYLSTANPHHLPPSSTAAIGTNGDQANHNYDLTAFSSALAAGTLPQVTFIKPPSTDTGHPMTSSPLAEQAFVVNIINQLETSPQWENMAIIITYDDSDGWYDHVMPQIVNQSNDPTQDALLGPGLCGQAAPGAYQDRCGYGPRLPFLLISPFARVNYISHTLADQTSIIRLIEDTWLGSQRLGNQSFDALANSISSMFDFSSPAPQVLLDPTTGEVTSTN